jgi:hypothetical protein
MLEGLLKNVTFKPDRNLRNITRFASTDRKSSKTSFTGFRNMGQKRQEG